MSKVEEELTGLQYWGYYEDDQTFTLEITKEDVIKYLKNKLEIDNIKIS